MVTDLTKAPFRTVLHDNNIGFCVFRVLPLRAHLQLESSF